MSDGKKFNPGRLPGRARRGGAYASRTGPATLQFPPNNPPEKTMSPFTARALGVAALLIGTGLLFSSIVVSAADVWSLKAANGLTFAAIKGYPAWPVVATHYRTDKNEIRVIHGNDLAVKSYRAGAGRQAPFADGAMLVKLGYSLKKDANFEASLEPDSLQRIEYMLKDSKRFASTGGWGYARFVYDAATTTFKAYGGDDAQFAQECHVCHTKVQAQDYVFTDYVAPLP
jgi:hypothetical protein